MSYQVSQVGQVPVATEIQGQQVRYNPSFRSANVTYLENSPENDVYEKKGMSTGGKVTLVTLGAIAVAGLVDQFAFKGKYRNILWTKLQNAWNSLRGKTDDVAQDGSQKLSEKADDAVKTTKMNKAKRRKINDNRKPHTEIRRQKKVSRDKVESGKAPTKQEAIDIAHNNEITAKATAEAGQIGNNLNDDTVTELKSLQAQLDNQAKKLVDDYMSGLPSVQARNKQIASLKKQIKSAKGDAKKELEIKLAYLEREQYSLSKNSITTPVPKPQAKPVVDTVQQQIKGIEGSIKKHEQRIAGAKKMNKDTGELEAQLTNLQKKLEQLKA